MLIKDMQNGSTGFTVPWAFYEYPTSLGTLLFARGDYKIEPFSGGTLTIELRRSTSVWWELLSPLPKDEPLPTAPLQANWDWVQVKPYSEQEGIA